MELENQILFPKTNSSKIKFLSSWHEENCYCITFLYILPFLGKLIFFFYLLLLFSFLSQHLQLGIHMEIQKWSLEEWSTLQLISSQSLRQLLGLMSSDQSHFL